MFQNIKLHSLRQDVWTCCCTRILHALQKAQPVNSENSSGELQAFASPSYIAASLRLLLTAAYLQSKDPARYEPMLSAMCTPMMPYTSSFPPGGFSLPTGASDS